MHSSSPELTPGVRHLIGQLTASEVTSPITGPVYHVDGVGGNFYFAYEQLRNAAEYRERHLLLRGAIERFLVRHVDVGNYRASAAELINELTQAGYVPNHSVPITTLTTMDDTGARYGNYYTAARQTGGEQPKVLKRWIIQLLSVQLENLLVPTSRRLSPFIAFAYGHYLNAIDFSSIEGAGNPERDQTALYCAIHRTIFKSDLATTRFYALSANLKDLEAFPKQDFIAANQLIDLQYQSPLTNRLGRVVNRYAAPIRIMRELLVSNVISSQTLASRETVLGRVRAICQQQYQLVEKTATDRLIRTIIFIFLTKVLIGVSIEVPYDLLVAGMITWQPLIINIVFPPVYMMLIGLQAKAPGRQNTEVIASYIDRIVYTSDQPPISYKLRRRVTSPKLNTVFLIIYGLGFSLSFGLLIGLLRFLGFNLVNGLIFFVFFSAVSFLGLRLRQASSELRMLPERQNLIQVLADFLSTPFVRVGHWLSDRYAKANIVTRLLDVAIEFPLKTSLRLVQQWVGFMRDKQEEL
jgi:hypothetical protein